MAAGSYVSASYSDLLVDLRSENSRQTLQWTTKTMAIYEFECQACGRRFGMRILMSADETVKQSRPVRPACGSSATRQMVSACKTPVG
jgi:putative FmdB family regulatory protein